MEGKRSDGALDTPIINVVAVVPYLIMKTPALGRGKPKDAYDIYFIVKHYNGGIEALAKEFEPVLDKTLVIEMKEKLTNKFASEKHAGPKDVTDFMGLLDEEEIELIRRDAHEQIMAFIKSI